MEKFIRKSEFIPKSPTGYELCLTSIYDYFIGCKFIDNVGHEYVWVIWRAKKDGSDVDNDTTEFLGNSKGGLRTFKSLDSAIKVVWWANPNGLGVTVCTG